MKLAIIAIAIAFAFVIGNILFLLHMGKKPMTKTEDPSKVKNSPTDDSLQIPHKEHETPGSASLALVNTHQTADTDQISQRSRWSNNSTHENQHGQGNENPSVHDQQQSEQISSQSSDQSSPNTD
jgi:hypothetical protein